jgi:hypothetical protein
LLKAYLEPNIINWARRADWSGQDLRSRLTVRQLEPHFGIHGIYELARGFLSDGSRADAQRNFKILAELDPAFGPTVSMLLAKELDQLRHGAAVIPVLDSLDRTSTKYQVEEMAAGRLESIGAEFLARREARIDRDYAETVAQKVKQFRQARSAGAEMPTSFDDVLMMFDAQVPRMIRERLQNQVSPMEANELHARLDAFPALRTTVRADLYMSSIAMIHDTGAGRDKLDDYRHVIEASYASVFVTGDQQLANTAPRLNPGLRIVTWDELRSGR